MRSTWRALAALAAVGATVSLAVPPAISWWGATGCDLAFATDGGPEAGDASVPDGAILVAEGGGGPCMPDGSVVDQCPSLELTCCQGTCVNTNNDPNNCGSCGAACSGLNSMCHQAACAAPSCQPACAAGLTCCDLPTSPPSAPRCAVGGACPVACPPCG